MLLIEFVINCSISTDFLNLKLIRHHRVKRIKYNLIEESIEFAVA